MQTNLSTFTMHQNIRLGEKQSKIIMALNKVSKSVTSSGHGGKKFFSTVVPAFSFGERYVRW